MSQSQKGMQQLKNPNHTIVTWTKTFSVFCRKVTHRDGRITEQSIPWHWSRSVHCPWSKNNRLSPWHKQAMVNLVIWWKGGNYHQLMRNVTGRHGT